MAPDFRTRLIISRDTIARSEAITVQFADQGATLDSTFIAEQLDPLDPNGCPNHEPHLVGIVNSDSFTAARNIIKRFPEAKHNKIAVLNLASDEIPGGGWIVSLSTTQEEALCYSSTLYTTLKEEYYPWPNTGPGSVAGVFSPGIVVFRDDLDHDLAELADEDRCVMGVITVAAPRGPQLAADRLQFAKESDLNDLRGKIRLIYRMAARNGKEYVILGAMGCGVYGCPSQQVAAEMRSILLEDEFKGWFRNITFAVYSGPSNKNPNYDIFKKVFEGAEV